MNEYSYREVIIKTLGALTNAVSEESRYEVSAISKAIKSMALTLKDVEVVGIASILENKAQTLIEQEDYAYEHMHDGDFAYIENLDKVKKLCIKVFYTDKEFTVDMSKHQKNIDENKEVLQAAGRYDRLCRYADEKKVLDKIYCKIKGNLSFGESSPDPTEQTIRNLFPIELKEIHRLADNHIALEIKKAGFDKTEGMHRNNGG